MLGEPNTEQFEVVTELDGRIVHQQKIHDPFVRTSTVVKGLGAAWKALTSGIKVTTRVNGNPSVMSEIMMLDPHALAKSDLRRKSEKSTTVGFCST